MLLTRLKKEQLVAKMTDDLGKSKSVILVNYQGLKVNQIDDLKKKLREKGIGFRVIKNTLLKIALQKGHIDIDLSLLDQPIAIAWSYDDEIASAKLMVEFKKTAEQMKIIGGILNQGFIDENIIKQLAALPGREELYAKLVGSLNAPMYRLVNVLQGNLRSLVYILSQYNSNR